MKFQAKKPQEMRHPSKLYPWMVEYCNAFKAANKVDCHIRMVGHRYVVVRPGTEFYGSRYTAKQLQDATAILRSRVRTK